MRYDKISTYYKENISILIPFAISALCFNGLLCFFPYLEGKTIDSLYNHDFSYIAKLCLFFIGFVFFVQLNRFLKRFLVRMFANRMSLRMRIVALNNLLSMDLSYFTNHSAADILNKNLGDIYDVSEGIRKMTTEVFDTFLLILCYFGMLFYLDYKLAFLCVPFVLLAVLLSHYMKKWVYLRQKEYKKYQSIYKEKTLFRLNNELYYRGFGVEENYDGEYEESLEILKNKAYKAALFKGSLEPIYYAIALCGAGFVLYFGGKGLILGTSLLKTVGELSAFLSTYFLVSRKAGKTGALFNAYQTVKVSLERIKDTLTHEKIEKIEEKVDGDLVIQNLSLKYSTDYELPSISLKAKKGQIIGICGQVHSGKTTLLRALTGLYAYSGSAKLGGVEIRELCKYKDSYVGYQKNDVSLFSLSVLDNITLLSSGDTKKSIKNSILEKDNLDLGGILSVTNPNISGGQRKRLGIARAIFKEKPLLLFDDPFQSLDSTTRKELLQGLREYKDSICFVSSNQKEVLSKVDYIIFLDTVAEMGSYEELNKNTRFNHLMEGIYED